MARYEFPTTEADEIRFPSNPECVIRLRRYPSYGDVAAAIRETFRLVPDREAAPGEWQETRMFANLLQLAMDWNLEDDNGPIPLTITNLKALRPVDGDALLGAAQERMEGRSVEAEAPFVNGSSKSSRVTRSSRRRSS